MKIMFIVSALMIMLFWLPSFSSENIKVDSPSQKNSLALVYIYRPNKIICFGCAYNLKINEKKVTKTKNGVHLILNLKPGKTSFMVEDKTIETNLELGKKYYFLSFIVRNILLRKPDFVEVTESTVKQELEI